MSLVSELLSEIGAFLNDAKMSKTAFGRVVVNDGHFVSRLEKGSGVTTKTIEKVRAYIAGQRETLEPYLPSDRGPTATADRPLLRELVEGEG